MMLGRLDLGDSQLDSLLGRTSPIVKLGVAVGWLVGLAFTLAWGPPLILAGAAIGFLRYNFHPATIIMGDSGSLMMGYLLATIAIEGVLKTAAAVSLVSTRSVAASGRSPRNSTHCFLSPG